MMRLSKGILLTISLAAILSACQDKKATEAHEIVRPVLSTIVQPVGGPVATFAGSVEPQVSATLAFRLLGRLVTRDVGIGDLVTRGETLATLDASQLQLQVQAARADLSSAQAQYTNAAASEERQRQLLESKNTTQAIYDAAQQARDSAKAGVDQAEAALAKAEEQLGYAQLFSDFDGVVTATGAEVGQVVAAGQTVLTVARVDARDAVVDIPDQLTSVLSLGSSFTVALQSAPTITTKAKVREISPQADNATRTVRVRLGLVDAPPAFRLGSTVTATPDGASAQVVLLPDSSLLEQSGQASVWVVDEKSGVVNLKRIVVGAKALGHFTVESGLQPGMRVVTAGVNSLTEGQKVKVETAEVSQ